MCIWFSYYVSTFKLLVDNGEIKLDIIPYFFLSSNCLQPQIFQAKFWFTSKVLVFQIKAKKAE